MSRTLTLAELDGRVADIRRATTERLQSVRFDGGDGDWGALARRHREMLAILHQARASLGELRPPLDRAGEYRRYLAELDRQLILERYVLNAVEDEDFEGYQFVCRILARALPEIQAAGLRAGLRSARPTWAQRARIWVTLPRYVAQAIWRGRTERRAGRSWR